jgi:hypothetical protein
MTGRRGSPSPDDGRWIVVDGKRWRATDPGLDDRFRAELVEELMAARREVGRATRVGDTDAERRARERVHAAKVALGERGEPWWEPPSPEGRSARLGAVTLALARHRAPDRTICPSDVARAIGGDGWRSLMEPVREVVRDLARAGRVEVTQRGEVLDPDQGWRGPVRIRSTDADDRPGRDRDAD